MRAATLVAVPVGVTATIEVAGREPDGMARVRAKG